MPAPNQGAIIARLEAIQSDLTEVKSTVTDAAKREFEFVKAYERGHQEVLNRTMNNAQGIAKNCLEIEKIEKRVLALEDAIKPLIFANKILVWIGGVLGGSVIALIWSLLTGHAQIIFQ